MIDLSKEQALDANSNAIQQIKFGVNPDGAGDMYIYDVHF